MKPFHRHKWALVGYRRFFPVTRPFTVTGFGAEVIAERMARGYYGWDEQCECGKRRHERWSYTRPAGNFRSVSA